MKASFNIDLALLNKRAHVEKSPFYLTIIREGIFSVSVDSLPLIEYYILIDHQEKSQQIKAKVYKTVANGKWYDANYSEEAQMNSPEFGIPDINRQIKAAIDVYECQPVAQGSSIH